MGLFLSLFHRAVEPFKKMERSYKHRFSPYRLYLLVGDLGTWCVKVTPTPLWKAPSRPEIETTWIAADDTPARHLWAQKNLTDPSPHLLILTNSLHDQHRRLPVPITLSRRDKNHWRNFHTAQEMPDALWRGLSPNDPTSPTSIIHALGSLHPLNTWTDFLPESGYSVVPLTTALSTLNVVSDHPMPDGWHITAAITQSGGFSHCVTYKNIWVYGRVTPLPFSASQDQQAQTILQILQSTRDYVARFGLHAHDHLTATILIPPPIHPALQSAFGPHADLVHFLVSSDTNPSLDHSPDVALLYALQQQGLPLHAVPLKPTHAVPAWQSLLFQKRTNKTACLVFIMCFIYMATALIPWAQAKRTWHQHHARNLLLQEDIASHEDPSTRKRHIAAERLDLFSTYSSWPVSYPLELWQQLLTFPTDMPRLHSLSWLSQPDDTSPQPLTAATERITLTFDLTPQSPSPEHMRDVIQETWHGFSVLAQEPSPPSKNETSPQPHRLTFTAQRDHP